MWIELQNVGGMYFACARSRLRVGLPQAAEQFSAGQGCRHSGLM